jgi:hypothetical protein
VSHTVNGLTQTVKTNHQEVLAALIQLTTRFDWLTTKLDDRGVIWRASRHALARAGG